jgi:hypothetical protein
MDGATSLSPRSGTYLFMLVRTSAPVLRYLSKSTPVSRRARA